MSDQYWNYIVTFVGLLGFYLGGKKIWWSWYVNIANQALWLTFGLVTHQWGFVVGTFFYTPVFVRNAYLWTKEHREEKESYHHNPAFDPGLITTSLGPMTADGKGVWYTPNDIILTEALHKQIESMKMPRPWYCPKWYHERYHEVPVKFMGGEKLGHVDEIFEDEHGLMVNMKIDRSTPAGQHMWDIIAGPPPRVSMDLDADEFVEGVTKADHGVLSEKLIETARGAARSYKGMDGEDCQSFTVWQGREISCEVNAHPTNFEHQHILADAMPPLKIRWRGDASPIAEELGNGVG